MTAKAVTLALAGACALAVGPQPASAQDRPAGFAGLGIEDRLDGPSPVSGVLAGPGTLPEGVGLFVRLHAAFEDLRAGAGDQAWSTLDDRLDAYASLGARVLLVIEGLPSDTDEGSTWSSVVRTVAEHTRGRVEAFEIGRSPQAPLPDVQTYAFYLKLAAVQILAADEEARVAALAVGPEDADWLDRLYDQDTEAYLDVVVLDAAGLGGPRGDWPIDAVLGVVTARDPTAELLAGAVELSGGPAEAAREWHELVLRHLGGPLSRMAVAADATSLAAILEVAGHIADLLTGEVVTLDPESTAARVEASGRDVTTETDIRFLFNLSTLARYVVYEASRPLELTLADRTGLRPVRRDAPAGVVEPVETFRWDQARNRATVALPPAPGTQLLDFDFGASTGLVSRERVVGSAMPSVSEVVFREQQVRAVQDALFSSFTAFVRLEQHFRPTPTDAFDVVTTNRFYVDEETTEWEELSFAVNGTEWGSDRPAFPLLQAEKVLSLPLDVQLTTDYQYRLEGLDRVDGRSCFVVRFDPVGEDRSLYRGRIWIDTETYRRVRVTTVQTQMSGTVVSSEETQRYELIRTPDGRVLNLVTQVTTKQIFLIAGRNLLMEKEAWFSDFAIDPPDFEARRRGAYLSDRVMYRDTDQGIRYLTRQGDERVVSDRMTTSARALAMGTTIDPTFDFPLPILGLNYLDFDFLGDDSQLALLYGGVLVLGNVQFPGLWQTPLDGSVDLFAIAVPGNDLVFDATAERTEERLQRIPLSLGFNVGHQVTAFQRVSLNYSFGYDVYFAGPETADDFVAPVDTATHGVTLTYEYSRRGLTVEASVGGFRRGRWAPWGRGEGDPEERDYRRYSVVASKDFFPGPFQTIHVEGAWYGGHDLDRFSMYQFGLFDALRMHGVPSAGVRFRELALTRLSYSFNVLEQFRLDLFLDQAVGRHRETGSTWQPVTGTGAALNVRAPWRTMLRLDVGKGFLPRRWASAGSVVVQILLLKPF